MSPNERRSTGPKRGTGASRDGKNFEKRDGASNNSKPARRGASSDFKPRYKEAKDSRPSSREAKDRFSKDESKFSGGTYKKTSDNSRFSPRAKSSEDSKFSARPNRKFSDDSNSSARPYRKFSDDTTFPSRSDRGSSEGSPRSGERKFEAKENLKNFKETRFSENKKKMRSRKPVESDTPYNANAKYSKKKQLEHNKKFAASGPSRLNKHLANAGICSRREADDYIKSGVVTVNGKVVTEMGAKVMPGDKVLFHDQLVRSEKKVYVLLNKPKDCVTTTDDPGSRLTVMDLVKNACNERIYPVGRLDKNTTGVLLITNDGDLALKLTHPKFEKKKIYHAFLDKAFTKADMKKVAEGIELEDGTIKADEINYVEANDKKQIGIQIHSGKNRIVRRIFESLGYKVVRLDRVFFAGLTKKNIPRGKWRHLSEKEINMLNMGAFE